MDITPYVESLRRDLSTAAEAVGPEGRATAERMMLALEPAMRLALMEVLSQAAAEVTSELPAGTVEVRLRGREPELVVEVPAHPPPAGPQGPPPARSVDSADDDSELDGTIARVSLRIPESVKTRAEELANRSGHSLNAWIVTVLRAATSQRAVNVDIDLSSIPFYEEGSLARRTGNRRMTGWI